MSCGKIIGGGMGYNMRCGGLWMGNIAKCNSCRNKELKAENIRLQNQILKKQLKNLSVEKSNSLQEKLEIDNFKFDKKGNSIP